MSYKIFSFTNTKTKKWNFNCIFTLNYRFTLFYMQVYYAILHGNKTWLWYWKMITSGFKYALDNIYEYRFTDNLFANHSLIMIPIHKKNFYTYIKNWKQSFAKNLILVLMWFIRYSIKYTKRIISMYWTNIFLYYITYISV